MLVSNRNNSFQPDADPGTVYAEISEQPHVLPIKTWIPQT